MSELRPKLRRRLPAAEARVHAQALALAELIALEVRRLGGAGFMRDEARVEWHVPTLVGLLVVFVHFLSPTTVFARFDDGKAARASVDCSIVTGKWNLLCDSGTSPEGVARAWAYKFASAKLEVP